jgi:hypothetical protein
MCWGVAVWGDACTSIVAFWPLDVPRRGSGVWYARIVPYVHASVLVNGLLFTWLCLGVRVGASQRGSVGGAGCITVSDDVVWDWECVG